jgi:hypothetical protein
VERDELVRERHDAEGEQREVGLHVAGHRRSSLRRTWSRG